MNFSHPKLQHFYQRWFWPALSAVLFLLLVFVVAYDANVFERIATKRERSKGFLDGSFSDDNYKLILNKTIQDLNACELIKPSLYGISRIEIFLKSFCEDKKNKLDSSTIYLAYGIAASRPAIDSSGYGALRYYCKRIYLINKLQSVELDCLDDYFYGGICLYMDNGINSDIVIGMIRRLARQLVEKYPKNKLEAMPYSVNNLNVSLVRDKEMIPGFLIKYGVQFKDRESIELGVQQLRLYIQNGLNNSDSLPYHGINASNLAKFGLSSSCQDIGCLVFGLTDALAYIPSNHESRKELIENLTKTSETLRLFQQPDGCWRYDVKNPMSQIDISGTAMIGCAIEQAIRSGSLNQSWKTVSEKALRGILQHTRKNGAVECFLSDFSEFNPKAIALGQSNQAQGMTLALFSLVRQRQAEGKTNQ